MKILVLYHTAWIEAMFKSWQRSGNAEVAALPLPVVDWDKTPDLKDKIAKLIIDYAMIWRPDVILDVNGAGILPVSGQSRWTPELALVPWAEWWFDDPYIYSESHRNDGTFEPWLKALGCPLVKNFIWDATLAKEYSEWTGKTWTHLPTATDPELFSPDSAEKSPVKFNQVDFCFFGTFYQEPASDNSTESQEINHVVSRRIMHPEQSYFELLSSEPERFQSIASAFAKAKRHRWGAFDKEICDIKHKCNAKSGYFRRSNVLLDIAARLPSNIMAGDGIPSSLEPSKDKLYVPSCLSACYEASTISLDLANGQSFSGTNMRAYEIMAAGGIMVCNKRPDFDPNGEFDGKAYFSFEKPEEVEALCKKLKEDPALRSSVSAEARKLVRKSHSWLHRLPAIMDIAAPKTS